MDVIVITFIVIVVVYILINIANPSTHCKMCGRLLLHTETKHTVNIGDNSAIVCKYCYEKIIEKRQRKKHNEFIKLATNNVYQDKKTNRYISPEVKNAVWQRDRGKCVQCGSNKNLEFDHIIPVSKGGSNTARNIQLLCENCNRSKRDNIQ